MDCPLGFWFAVVEFDHDGVVDVVDLPGFDASPHSSDIGNVVQLVLGVAALVAADVALLHDQLSRLPVENCCFDLAGVEEDQPHHQQESEEKVLVGLLLEGPEVLGHHVEDEGSGAQEGGPEDPVRPREFPEPQLVLAVFPHVELLQIPQLSGLELLYLSITFRKPLDFGLSELVEAASIHVGVLLLYAGGKGSYSSREHCDDMFSNIFS